MLVFRSMLLVFACLVGVAWCSDSGPIRDDVDGVDPAAEVKRLAKQLKELRQEIKAVKREAASVAQLRSELDEIRLAMPDLPINQLAERIQVGMPESEVLRLFGAKHDIVAPCKDLVWEKEKEQVQVRFEGKQVMFINQFVYGEEPGPVPGTCYAADWYPVRKNRLSEKIDPEMSEAEMRAILGKPTLVHNHPKCIRRRLAGYRNSVLVGIEDGRVCGMEGHWIKSEYLLSTHDDRALGSRKIGTDISGPMPGEITFGRGARIGIPIEITPLAPPRE